MLASDNLFAALSVDRPRPPASAWAPRRSVRPAEPRLVRHPPVANPWGLNGTQAEILRLLAEGLDQVAIAPRVERSLKGVHAAVLNAKRAMKASSTEQAVVMWDRHVRGRG